MGTAASRTDYEPLTDAELLEAVKLEITAAAELESERSDNMIEAADYFYGRLPGVLKEDVDNKMSDMVSTDVADAVEAVLSEILPAFSGASPVEFTPFGLEDEPQADAETRVVNHVVASAGGYMAINMAIKDALLRRAGVVKVYWEDLVTVTYETLEQVPQEALPGLLQERQNEAVEIVEGSIDDETGMVSAVVRRYSKRGKPRVEAVPRDEFLISSQASMPDADAGPFVCHRRPVTRTYLVQLGFDPDLVASLETYNVQNMETAARSAAGYTTQQQAGHASTEQVLAAEAYYRIDQDGDGIAELLRVVTAGGAEGTDTLLGATPWGMQPFCIGIPYLGLYTWDGVSLHDKLKGVQDTKTSLLRDLINATKRNVRQRVGAVERMVNLDDLASSVMGGTVRIKTPNAVVPLPDVQVPPALFSTLEYMDQVRKDKGGGAIDTAAQVAGIAGDTAHGVERVMSAAEQVNAMVAKNLAETLVKPLYLKMHYLLRAYQKNPVVVPGSVGWISSNPGQWQPREEVVLSLGMSVGERGRRSAALSGILQIQQAAQAAGLDGILVGSAQVYQTVMDMTRMSGLPSPEQYWINPASPEAQQAAQQKAQQAQEAQKMQHQLTMAQINIGPQMEQIKAQAVLQRQQMVEMGKRMQSQIDAMLKTFDQRIKLEELNAKYDEDPVADSVVKLQQKEEAHRQQLGQDAAAFRQQQLQAWQTHELKQALVQQSAEKGEDDGM